MPDTDPARDRLASRLRELRAATGLSGNRFAVERIHWAQSRLSRVELGRQLPTKEDIHAWVVATEAGPGVTDELLDLLRRAQAEYISHRDEYRRSGGGAGVQAKIGRKEAKATHLRSYQPGLIPGLLQTPEYARELLSLPCGPLALGETPEEIERMIAARVKRQEILYQPGRRLRFVVGEPALRTPPGSIETLIGQLDRLTAVAGLSSVELGIGLLGEPMPVFPLSGFALADDHASIETLSGEQTLSDPPEVELYAKAFEQLMAAAATGPDAVALIRQVIAELR